MTDRAPTGLARRRIICIKGPTGAGKSAAALELASHGGFEIVSVDSAMIYRGMDVGTAKPTAQERARVIHHGIDIRDPAEHYSVGDFLFDLPPLLEDIWRRGREPLLVGGTMMYFNALKHGLARLPARDAAIRARLAGRAGGGGWAPVPQEREPGRSARPSRRAPGRRVGPRCIKSSSTSTLSLLHASGLTMRSGFNARSKCTR